MPGWLNWLGRGRDAVVEPAGPRDSARLAALHAASFHRGWGVGEFDDMLRQRNVLAQRLRAGRAIVGFAISRLAADEAEILSIALDPAWRGKGLSTELLRSHLGHLAGLGTRTVFLEVEENNAPARRLYDSAGFTVTGRRERYYREAGGAHLNALLMRRDLS